MEPVKEKGKKAGRPAKTVRKDARITIRFSTMEYFIIKEKSVEAGVKPSVYLRHLGINGGIVPRLTEEERHFVRQLIGMANNLNQMAKTCHQEGTLSAALYFEQIRVQLETLLKKFKL